MTRLVVVLVFLVGGLHAAHADPSVSTSSAARAASPEDIELARFLSLLENWELIQELEMLELMPLLEEEDEG